MNTPAQMAAVERLMLSRERLRAALRDSATAAPWAAGLGTLPGVLLLLERVRAGWSRQPLRAAGVLAAGAARPLLQPLATRHPWLLVAGAAAAGAVLARVSPWRALAGLAAGLVPQLLASLLAQPAPARPPARPSKPGWPG